MTALLSGYLRPSGQVGARNHLIVVPSVVCANLVCRRIAESSAIALEHQHGCAEVGPDVDQTASILAGVAANPNVGAALIVGLGCETIQASDVAARARALGARIEVFGIQACGGTGSTVDLGRTARDSLITKLDQDSRVWVAESAITVGIDADTSVADALVDELGSRGIATIVARSGAGPSVHAELAGAGAQILVTTPGPNQAPSGFVVCPTIAIGCNSELHRAIADDFDDDGGGTPEELAQRIAMLVPQVFSGVPTAAEIRGSRDFVLRRLMRTM